MPKYAQFDPQAASPARVKGWFDTDAMSYTNLPPGEEMMEVNETVWQAHFANATEWAVFDGKTGTIEPHAIEVVVTRAMRAFAALSGSVIVRSIATPTVNGNYRVDTAAQQTITSIASAIAAGLGTPSQQDTFLYLDADKIPHVWTSATFMAFAKAVLNLCYALRLIAEDHEMDLPALDTEEGLVIQLP